MMKKLLFIILICGVFIVTGGDSMKTQQTSQKPEETTQLLIETSTLQTPQYTVTKVNNNTHITPTPIPTPIILVTKNINSPITGTSTDKKIAYITIDDGPSTNNTTRNLETLKRYGIKATFFVLPRQGVDDVYKRILSEGHEISNHSYSHDTKTLYKDIKFFEEDLINARSLVEDKLGYITKIYRFPGGTMGRNKTVIAERVNILEKYGYKYYDWDVTTGDSDTGPAGKVKSALVNNVLNNTRGRNKLIILMHDSSNKETTTEALPDIIDGLKNMGYSFDILSNY